MKSITRNYFVGAKLILIALMVFTLFCAQSLFAQEEENLVTTDTLQADTVADVGVYNANVELQEGEVIVTFSLENNGAAQPDVFYSVQIYESDEAGQATYLVDEVVADQVIALGTGEVFEKELVYNAPQYLNGNFVVWIYANNSSGVPLGVAKAGELILDGHQLVDVHSETCFVSIAGEDTKYETLQGVDVDTDEVLLAHCEIENISDKSLTLTTQFDTTARTATGNTVEVNNTNEVVVLSAGERRLVSVEIPRPTEPQSYTTVFALLDGDTKVTEDMKFHYVVRGGSATIQELLFDETKNRDLLEIYVSWTLSADGFLDARKDATVIDGPELVVTAVSESGDVCSQTSRLPIEQTDGLADEVFNATLELQLDDGCSYSSIQVEIVDSSGVVLGEKVSDIQIAATETAVEEEPGVGALTILVVVALITFLLVAIALMVLAHKRDWVKYTVIVLILVGGIVVYHTAQAVTVSLRFVCDPSNVQCAGSAYSTDYGRWMVLYDNGTMPTTNDSAYAAVQLDNNNNSTCYAPGSTITVSASGAYTAVCGNGAYSYVNATVNGVTKGITSQEIDGNGLTETTTNYPPRSNTFTAPSTPGDHNATAILITTHGGTMTRTATMPYTVCENVSTVPTVTLDATPNTIDPGDSSILTWTVTDATSCTGDLGGGNGVNLPIAFQWNGPKSVSGGSQTISNISSGQTFRVICSDDEGNSASASDTVFVSTPPPATVSLTWTSDGSTHKDVANGDDPGPITIASTNATTCDWSGDWGVDPSPGALNSSALPHGNGGHTNSQTYSVRCQNIAGVWTAVESVTVDVYSEPVSGVSISQAPATTASGEDYTVSWTSENADRCEIERRDSNEWTGVSGAWVSVWDTDTPGFNLNDDNQFTGNASDYDVEQDWRITCTNNRPNFLGGNIMSADSTTHLVYAPPQVTLEICDADFAGTSCASVEKVADPDQQVAARWNVASGFDVSSCSGSGDGLELGGTSNSGSDPIWNADPDSARTYQVQCSGAGGAGNSNTVTLSATAGPSIVVDKPSVPIGEEVEIIWDTEGATDCTLTNSSGAEPAAFTAAGGFGTGGQGVTSGGGVMTNGIFSETIQATETYTLSCVSNGDDTATVIATEVIHEI